MATRSLAVFFSDVIIVGQYLFGSLFVKALVKEMVDKKGFIGIFLGGFKNCAAGLSAALVFSYIASLLCQPKMKKH